MSRAAFIGLILDQESRARLDTNLSAILPGSADQRRRFIDAAEESVDYYRKLAIPAALERRELEAKLSQLVDAGKRFCTVVSALGPDARDMIEQAQWSTLGAGQQKIPKFQRTLEAAKWAEITARAAERLLARPRRAAQRTPPGVSTLIMDLAEAYERTYGERPSAARLGSP